MQPEPAQKVFYDKPLYASKPTFTDPRIKRAFTFGIANGPIVLPPTASVRDQAHFASLRRIDRAEAVRLLAERLKAKTTLATRDPLEARLLFHELNTWRPRSGDLLGEPAPSAALAEALGALERCQHAPAAASPPPDVAAIKAQLATLTAQLDRLEAQGTGR